ncbi:hypothetical protein CBR_g36453 [Chara braunii]|uniref:RHOMBOID-like protein n=1 Tax=Chara braunii TaxID=69332 RepID=A0A388LKR5_CHABU|nr:hypothetical protein CBR_g36453 [Chara braunii]|eukprot:GBG82926.1 hypothetical protein CBR_g36453 [Chara braunii]
MVPLYAWVRERCRRSSRRASCSSAPPESPLPPRVWRFTWHALFGVSIFFFIISLGINKCVHHKPKKHCSLPWLGVFSFEPLGDNPLLGPSGRSLSRVGALDPRHNSKTHQEFRVFTCLYLHSGVLHLWVNFLVVMFIAPRLEHEFGTARMMAIYFGSGVGGALWSALLLVPDNVSVGASFPTCGLIAMTLVDILYNKELYVNKIAAAASLLLAGVVMICVGLVPFVDNWGHLGGFVTGFILSLLILYPVKPQSHLDVEDGCACKKRMDWGIRRKLEPYMYYIWIVSVMLITLGFLMAFIALFSAADQMKDCTWCHKMNCSPSSLWTCPTQKIYTEPARHLVCKVTKDLNNMGTVTCKSGKTVDIGDITKMSADDLKTLCRRCCGGHSDR